MKEFGTPFLLALAGLALMGVGGFGGCYAGMLIGGSLGPREGYGHTFVGALIGLALGVAVGIVAMIRLAMRARSDDE